MALLGMHGGHASHGGGHGHSSDTHGFEMHGASGQAHGAHAATAHGSMAHGHTAHGNGHENGAQGHGVRDTARAANAANTLLGVLSPRVIFSVMLGFGACGTLGKAWVAGWMLVLAAVAGGLFFEGLMMRPMWNFFMGFASQPARTLESSVLEEARAVTNFDRDGRGLIALELNGENVQLLGRLRPEDRLGNRVLKGDAVFIVEVDAARNTCVVSSYEGAPK